MAIQADQHGFLLGEPVDLGRMPKYLQDIRTDVAAIRKAVVGTSTSAKNRVGHAPTVMPIRPRRDNAEKRTPAPTATKTAMPGNRNGAVATPDKSASVAAKKAGVVGRLNASSKTVAVTPKRDASGRFVSDKAASGALKRDASGRFTGAGEGGGDSPGAVTALANRLAALAGVGSGIEDVDPTVKAFREVAEPMQRGIEFFSGGDNKERWPKKIFGVLSKFRKEESTFSRAATKSLRNIEDNPVSAGDGDNSGMMMGLAARLGPALLAGITAVLGFIFSPIGLAIGAASALAWGLFTESGQKFFGEVGAKLIAGWDTVVSAFAPITDAISKKFDSLINGMASTWDAFTGFLKDKFGIDVPALFKPVVDLGKKVVDAGAEVVKNTTNKAVDAVQKSSPKTTEALGNAWDKVAEGAGKIKARATGKMAENKAALLKEMAAQGITDPKEQAMLMAQVDHESGGFAFTKELGRDSYFDKYDAGTKIGARLGNTEQGDGLKYKGRGLIQLTGRSNYEAAGKDLGLDLVNHPELAETPENAAKTALWFWKKNKLGESAKQGDIKSVTHKINGGENGLADRSAKYEKYLAESSKAPAVASLNDDPTQGGRYKYETLDGGKVQVTDNETGIMELASDAQANAYRKQQGKPYLDKIAAINAGNVASQTVSAPVPAPPIMPTAPKLADAPQVIQPLSTPDQRPLTVSIANQDVGQDLSDRKIAHIVTGGLSG
jgi:predicted chitinase